MRAQQRVRVITMHRVLHRLLVEYNALQAKEETGEHRCVQAGKTQAKL